MKNVLVTAAIIQEGPKVLLTQRLPGGAEGRKWEFPGGKVEPGESPEEALRREIQEELAMSISVSGIAEVITYKKQGVPGQEDNNIILLYYYCRREKGQPTPLGCLDYCWTTLPEILSFDLAPADRQMAEKLVRKAGWS